MTRSITALQTMAAAVNAGDASRYAEVYADDAVITIFGGDTLRGRDSIRNYEVELLRAFPGTRFAFLRVWEHESVVVAHYAVAGPAMGHEGLLFFWFDDAGHIVAEHRYLDSLTPMAQLGALGRREVRSIPSIPSATETYSSSDSAVERRNIEIARDETPDVIDEMVFPRVTTATEWLRMWAPANATTEIVNAVAVGDFVLAETLVRGTLNGELAGVRAAGQPFVIHRATVSMLKEGRIVRTQAFFNGKELATAVGAQAQ